MFGRTISFFVLTITLLSIIVSTRAECLVTEYDRVEAALQNCSDIVISNLTVPAGKQLLLNIRNGSTLTFKGQISFEHKFWVGPLVQISGSNFLMKGEKDSVLDGNGPLYWDGKGTWGNTTKPRFLKINAHDAVMKDITILNCPIVCVQIRGCSNLTINNWEINILDGNEGVAPPKKYAHNTDGFTIDGTTNLLIENSIVYNQDDCVSVKSGQNITVRNIYCNGSHGLSISGEDDVLENVLIEKSTIANAENGIHVKCHVGSPPGLLKNITYRDITILDSKYYGINIQQNYVNLPPGVPMDGPPDNNVKIYDLKLINITGYVQYRAVPVFILCADKGCFNWNWNNVNITGVEKNNCTGYNPDGFVC